MTITLTPELESRLAEVARRRGVTPDALANEILRDRLRPPASPIEPQDEWERKLLSIATDCGVSLPDEALTAEGIYE